MSLLTDLIVVMPVFNEAACIFDVVKSWQSMLSNLCIDYRIVILNDGSIDGTKEALGAFTDERIEVINKENSGHGPTILLGYKMASRGSRWVFQCDSDDEMKPDAFPTLWRERENFDALFGIRKERNQNLGRKVISACSRITVRLLFTKGVSDVNTPYRLIRADILEQIVRQIPDDTFAPNVIIAGALSRARLRIYELAVFHENRKTGKVSIVKWKLWRSALKAFCQTLSCRGVGSSLVVTNMLKSDDCRIGKPE